MAPPSALWTAQSLHRYRFPLIAATCLAAGATIYYLEILYQQSREVRGGLHRSNAGRRRRQRRSQGVPPESEELEAAEQALHQEDLGNRPDLAIAETDTDGVSEYSWEEQDELQEKEGQSLLLLLYKIAEEQSRRDGYVHRGVSCNSCNEHPIKGIRYRCANCADYDLCETCEAAHTHNREHLFWKIRIPAPHIGGSSKECLPPFYPGKPKTVIQDLQREKVEYFCKETGYKAEEVEALWEQFRSMAAVEYRNDPDHYHLAIDRIAFDKCFIPRTVGCTPSPNLLYNRIFAYYDTNNDGLIGFGEFIRGLASLKRKNAAERLKRVFKAYDINNDGYVDRRDFLRIFRAYYTVTKDLMSDVVAGMQEEDDQDVRDLVSSSQPISAGFSGPGVMQRDGRRISNMGKDRDDFGDIGITDGMGVIKERNTDPQTVLLNMVSDNAERAAFEGIDSPLSNDSSLISGQIIQSFVTHQSQESIDNLLGFYGHPDFASKPAPTEEAWTSLRRELQSHMAWELLRRRWARHDTIVQRLRRQSYYQDGDKSWLAWDVVAPPDLEGLNADPRVHTQMAKDLRDIESCQLVGAVENDLSEVIEKFRLPIYKHHLGAPRNKLILRLIREGWTLKELCWAFDGYSPDPSHILKFFEDVSQVLARRARQARSERGFKPEYSNGSRSSNSSNLRLGNEQWSCPEGDELKPKGEQDTVLSVTEEALNELLDPVFRLREDFAIMAMYERPPRRMLRKNIVATFSCIKHPYILKRSLMIYLRRWRQKSTPRLDPGEVSLETETYSFNRFLKAMLSGQVNSENGTECEVCLKNDHHVWVRFDETCSEIRNHPNKKTGELERLQLNEVGSSPEKCLTCSRAEKELWITGLYCGHCRQPRSWVRKEEIKMGYSVESGGESLTMHVDGNKGSKDKTASSRDRLPQNTDETVESSEKDSSSSGLHPGLPDSMPENDMDEAAESSDEDWNSNASEPGSAGSLCDGTPLEFEDYEESPQAYRDRMASEVLQPNELIAQADDDSPKQQRFSSSSETQRPDPTLPQNRPSSISPQILSSSVHPTPSSSTANRKRAKRSATKTSDKIQYRQPKAPNADQLTLWMCLDILEADDKDRGGPGRINFEEFEEIMLGEKGPALGFLLSWVDLGTF